MGRLPQTAILQHSHVAQQVCHLDASLQGDFFIYKIEARKGVRHYGRGPLKSRLQTPHWNSSAGESKDSETLSIIYSTFAGWCGGVVQGRNGMLIFSLSYPLHAKS